MVHITSICSFCFIVVPTRPISLPEPNQRYVRTSPYTLHIYGHSLRIFIHKYACYVYADESEKVGILFICHLIII